jgi:hypothetical protein
MHALALKQFYFEYYSPLNKFGIGEARNKLILFTKLYLNQLGL